MRYSKDKAQLKRVMDENKEIYNNIDRDTREVLAVVANVRIPEEYKVVKDGEERFQMCKAFEDYKLEGKLEMLIDLVNDDLLPIKDAALRAGITEEAFKEKMQRYNN